MTSSTSSGLAASAASAMAGAVLRATGSRISDWGGVPASVSWLSTRSACRCPATTIGAAKSLELVRCAVSCSMVSSEVSGQKLLGHLRLDIGQRRVPEPPDRMTGTIGLCMNAPSDCPYHLGITRWRVAYNDRITHIFMLRLSFSAKIGTSRPESGGCGVRWGCRSGR